MNFAEFLNASSSVRLCFLSSPTCVGLWYGPPRHMLSHSFPARGAARFSGPWAASLPASLSPRICLGASQLLRFARDNRRPGAPCRMRHDIAPAEGTGMLTRFPSSMDFSLNLGAG